MSKAKGRRRGGSISIRDVAREAGVAIVTVSRVINGSQYVKEETRHRVETAMKRLGYHPRASAQSMRTNVTRTIGFMLPDLTNLVNARIAQAAEETLSRAGYYMILGSSMFDVAREADFLKLLRNGRIDGLIIQLSDEGNADIHKLIGDSDVPIVVVDRDLPFDIDCVLSEHYESARKMTEHLIALGHKRIAIIASSFATRAGRERVRGFNDAMTEAGIEVAPEFVRHEHQVEEYGMREAYAMLSRPRRPTAIFAAGNQILYGVLQAIRTLGVRIPDDLSLVAADETDLSPLVEPPITVIHRDTAEIGRSAAELLLARLGNHLPDLPMKVMTRSEIVLRQSCAAPQTE